ncbi:MAG TPA: 1,6-anhydro-N-acetylmuramyl-L-alanine amidase AmpD [Gammaproteobacteria bacterium]|nr:1,6-anhydro-N-acetylmuramyl-L-alanine amidase AmpD [Gammaproteobacteria bacterium]
MKIDAETGLLEEARQVPSPNFNERPSGAVPELIVIHGISLPPGEFGGTAIDRFFTNCLDCSLHPYFSQIEGLQVSSHLLIGRGGEIVQYVPFSRRAWHAGVSSYRGRENCNDFSIGIELEGTDELPYAEAQYRRLTEVVACLLRTYDSLSAQDIVGHSDIAPGRKTDPGPAFDWAYFRQCLNLVMQHVSDD